MVDGTAVVELGKLLLDAEPMRGAERGAGWTAAPAPSAAERFARAIVAAPPTARRSR